MNIFEKLWEALKPEEKKTWECGGRRSSCPGEDPGLVFSVSGDGDA